MDEVEGPPSVVVHCANVNCPWSGKERTISLTYQGQGVLSLASLRCECSPDREIPIVRWV